MQQKIIKIGSSTGITLRPELLRAAGLKLGDTVDVTSNQVSGLIEIKSATQDQFSRDVAEGLSLVRRYRQELDKLGEE